MDKDIPNRDKKIPMELTPEEVKLVLRLRMLRKQPESRTMLILTHPLTVNVSGVLEKLESKVEV